MMSQHIPDNKAKRENGAASMSARCQYADKQEEAQLACAQGIWSRDLGNNPQKRKEDEQNGGPKRYREEDRPELLVTRSSQKLQ